MPTTPAERRVLDAVAERRGRAYAEEHRELILASARLVGELGLDERTATDAGEHSGETTDDT